MNQRITRRNFMVAAAGAGAMMAAGKETVASPAAPAQAAASAIQPAVLISMLPKTLSYADRFKIARDVGFQLVEGQTVAESEAEEIAKAAQAAGVRIHSVMNMAHWKYPLSSSDSEAVEKSLEGMRLSMQNAKMWGADAVLLVPAVVNEKTSYRDAWTRSQAQIKKLIPLAEKLKVVIAIEEVWNKFLLSPVEFANYVDEFRSPWIKAYFDVGNVVLFGYPEDWIRTLGQRIVKVHIKDFQRKDFKFVDLGEGSIDWPAVRQAFAEIGYKGPATVELRGGDEAYLRDVRQRVSKLVLGEGA